MKPKKILGQNFLSDRNILEMMVRSAQISKKDVVLEVGPGRGTLTKPLAREAKRVIAVEKDRGLADFLKIKFSENKNIKIIKGDILKIHNPKLLIHNSGYKIVANIPYYITSHFLKIFL